MLRQELNLIKRGKGFDWGAGATSCAIWRGVPLVYLLEKAGVKCDDDNDKRRPKFVCFEGAETLHKVRNRGQKHHHKPSG